MKKPHIELRDGWWACDGSIGVTPMQAYSMHIKFDKMNADMQKEFNKAFLYKNKDFFTLRCSVNDENIYP